jgi:hypothetical protein
MVWRFGYPNSELLQVQRLQAGLYLAPKWEQCGEFPLTEIAMKQWLTPKILIGSGCILILLGIAPLAFALWEASQSRPLSMPLPLKRGEYTSPYFRTYLSGTYQIDVDSLPFERTPLDLDWTIVDDRDAAILQGSFVDPERGSPIWPGNSHEFRGNTVGLGAYRPRFGLRQRIITRVHKDVEASNSIARLEIGQPEISLELSYGSFLLLGWAGVVGGTGGVMLLILLIQQQARKHSSF